jgi:FixJ family two-component response regulator
MQQREVPLAARRVVIITPNLQMAEELDPLVAAHLTASQLTHLRNYPSPRELGGILGQGNHFICFLDVATNSDRAFELLKELAQPGLQVQTIALLSGDDPNLILRCMRAGASDFLIQPFNSEQIQGALGKLSRQQPTADASGREPAKVFATMPAKGRLRRDDDRLQLRLSVQTARQEGLAGRSGRAYRNGIVPLKIKATHSFLDALLRAHELDKDLWTSDGYDRSGRRTCCSPPS